MAGGDGGDPLVSSQYFNYSDRRRTDVFWGVLYGIFLALTIVGGVYGITHRNRAYFELTAHDVVHDPSACPWEGRNLLEAADPADFSISDFMKHAALWLVVSAGVSLMLGLVFLWLFQKHSYTMTRATIQVQVLLPAAMGIAAMVAGQVGTGIVMVLMSLLAAVVFYMWRNEIDLCARLLGVAAAGLRDNPGLLGFVVAAKVGLVGLALPLVGMLTMAYTNGYLAPNSARIDRNTCVDKDHNPVPCCVWQPEGWVPAYMSLGIFSLLWTVMLVFTLRVYVVSGAIAQWYFAAPGLTNFKGTTLRMVKWGLGEQFGSLSLGAAILSLTQLARQAMEQAREDNRGNIIMYCITLCLEAIYTLIEYLTKFAVVRMAMTGEAFFEAGHRATDLLRRNFLKAFGVWWFPPMVIQLAAFLLSAAWGLAIFTASWVTWHHQPTGSQEAAALGILSFLMSFVVLAFFGSVLLNVVDAVFFCYAVDKDMQTVTRADVHDVFSQVPVGVAVEQPGGGLAYGAPSGSPRGVRYVPPASPAAATTSIV
jgi:hypothetical protein